MAVSPFVGRFPRVLLQILFLPELHPVSVRVCETSPGPYSNPRPTGLDWVCFRFHCIEGCVSWTVWKVSVIADFRCLLEALHSVAPEMHCKHF